MAQKRQAAEADQGAIPRPSPASASAGAVPITALEMGRGLRLELLLRPGAESSIASPFLTLGPPGRYARAHLARIVDGQGATIRHLVLKLQRDRYDVETDRGNVLSNREIAELWRKELRNLRALQGDLDAPAAELLLEGEGPAGEEGPAVQPPIIYCRKQRVFFHPPCPFCGRVLRDCEDDGLLTRRGLSRHSETNIRYLFCEACHRSSPDAPLYRAQAVDRERKGGVREWKRLCEDWSRPALAPEGGAPSGEDFPCRACAARSECYGPAPKGSSEKGAAEKSAAEKPGGLASQRLVPLSFHDFRVLPLEVLRLQYDEFSDCLGGIGWSEFLAEHRGGREGPAEELFLADLRERLGRDDRYLFAGTGGLEAAEVLRLKLVLFSQLCRAVRRFHDRTGGAHLDLKPENVMVELPPVTPELPYLWNFRVKLIDLAATTDFTFGEGGERGSIPIPPVNYAEVYTSPAVRRARFGHQKPCDLQFIGDGAGGEGGARLRARLRSGDLIPEEYSAGDVFRITLQSVDLAEPIEFWARPAAAAEPRPGELEVLGEARVFPEGVLAAVASLRGWQRGVHLEIYPALGESCDLYSLGVILLRTLLCGQRQNLATVATRVLQPVLNEIQRLADAEPGTTAPPGASTLEGLVERVREMLSSNPLARPELVRWDGEAGRKNAIPLELWYDALILAVRLAAEVPGFGYGSPVVGAPAVEGPAVEEVRKLALDAVLADLDRLGARVHSALFEREEMHREVRAAISQAAERLASPEGGGTVRSRAGAGAAAPAESLIRQCLSTIAGALSASTADGPARTAAVGEALAARLASAPRDEALEVLAILARKFPVRVSPAEERCAALEGELSRELARARAREAELEGKVASLERELRAGGAEEIRRILEKLCGKGGPGRDDPRKLAAIVEILAETINKTIGYANVSLQSWEFKDPRFRPLEDLVESLIEGDPAKLADGLRRELGKLRDLLKALIRADLQFTPKWCESQQKKFGRETFEAPGGRGKPWDRYLEFIGSYDFREDLLHGLRTYIDGEWKRTQG